MVEDACKIQVEKYTALNLSLLKYWTFLEFYMYILNIFI